MATAIIEIKATDLQVGDIYDTRCGVADLAFQTITSVEHFTLPGGGDRVEIGYTGDAICNRRILVAGSTVRVKVEAPEAPTAPQSASEHARSVCQPTDHQPKAERTRSGKVGTLHQRAMLAYRNAGKVTTAEFLASIGADADTIRRFASAFGRKVAQAYRAATGSEPTKNGAALVRGQLMRVFAYADRSLLESTARGYHATAALVEVA